MQSALATVASAQTASSRYSAFTSGVLYFRSRSELKPLDPEQVTEAVHRLLAYLRPFEVGPSWSSASQANGDPTPNKMRFSGMANELLPVGDVDRDRIRLLARREIVAALRRDRRTWVHTVREEFATYFHWLSSCDG
jgi:hypothetical protein